MAKDRESGFILFAFLSGGEHARKAENNEGFGEGCAAEPDEGGRVFHGQRGFSCGFVARMLLLLLSCWLDFVSVTVWFVK